MRNSLLFAIVLISILFGCTTKVSEETSLSKEGPIQLHPDNPHYFLYKGEPLVLITSAEHYGAVLNLDFDYKTYLNTLAQEGMNYTRIFTGTYFELPGDSFGIQNNTLAPEKGKVITPWTIVVADLTGQVKYDLSSWNEFYFERLRNFISLADSLDIIVEVTLFSSIYSDEHWDICPQNPDNNVNITHEINRLDAQTLNNGVLIQFQETLVRKIVSELNDLNNFFFEIQNEPWADRPVPVYNIVNKEELNPRDWSYKADFGDEEAMAWQERIATIIEDEESTLDKKHLIALNYTNFVAPISEVVNNISIINFHYAWPDAVDLNYHFNKVIGFDETGFSGSSDEVYRRQAWRFIMSGGGLFNSLDYSFFPGHEDGLGQNQAPGGGSKELRRQLKILSDFIHGFDLIQMIPDKTSIVRSPGLIPYVLSSPGQEYAIYLQAIGTSKTEFEIVTGDGVFEIQKLDPITGTLSEPELQKSNNTILRIELEIPQGDIALKIKKNR